MSEIQNIVDNSNSVSINKNNLKSLILLKQEVIRLYMSKEINKAILLCGEAINDGLIGRTIKDNLDQIYCLLQSNSIMFDKDWYSDDVIYVSLLEKVNRLVKEVHLCLGFFDLLFDMFMVKNDKKSYLSFIMSANRLLNNNSHIDNEHIIEKKISKNNQKPKGVIAFRDDGKIKRKGLDGEAYDELNKVKIDKLRGNANTNTNAVEGERVSSTEETNEQAQPQQTNQSLSKWEKIYRDIIDVLKNRIPSEKDWQEKGIHYHEAIADISNDSVLILDGALVIESDADANADNDSRVENNSASNGNGVVNTVNNAIKDKKVGSQYRLSKQSGKLLEVIRKCGYLESCTWYKQLIESSQSSSELSLANSEITNAKSNHIMNADEIKEQGSNIIGNDRDERLLLEIIKHEGSGAGAELEYIGKNTSDFKNTFIRIDLNKLDIEESNAEGLLLLLSLMVKLMGYESIDRQSVQSDFVSEDGESGDEKSKLALPLLVYLSRAKQRKVIVMGDNKIEQYVSSHIYKKAKQKQENTDILAKQLDKDRMVVLLNIVLRQFKQKQNRIYGIDDFVHDGASVIDIYYNGSQAHIRIPIILSDADAGAVLTDDNAIIQGNANSNANIPVISSRVHLKEVEEIDKMRGSRDVWLLSKMVERREEAKLTDIHSKTMLKDDGLGSRDANGNIVSSLERGNQELLLKNGDNDEQNSKIKVEIVAIQESKKEENDIEVEGFKPKKISNTNRVVIDLMPYYTDSVYIGDMVLDSGNGSILEICYFQYRVREVNLNNIGYLIDYLEQSIIVNNSGIGNDCNHTFNFVLDFAWVSYMQLDAVIELKKLLVMNKTMATHPRQGIQSHMSHPFHKNNEPNIESKNNTDASSVEVSEDRFIELKNKEDWREIAGITGHIGYKDMTFVVGYSDYRFKILNHEVVILNCNKMIQSLLFDFD